MESERVAAAKQLVGLLDGARPMPLMRNPVRVDKLDADLRSGAWDERHRALRDRSELHLGYYAVTAEVS